MFESSERHVKYEAAKYRERNVPVGLDAPLESPVNGTIHGRKWKPHIHFHEAPLLMTPLGDSGDDRDPLPHWDFLQGSVPCASVVL
jgi:hypothetical protein